MNNTLAVTCFTTRFDLLKQHWDKQAILRKKGVFGTNVPAPANQEGMVALLDWDKKELIQSVKQRSPSGVLQVGKKLYVNDAKENTINIYDISNLKLSETIRNKHFNDLHSIKISQENNLLTTSSGLDLIQIVDFKGKTKYEWWGFEHGFNKNPLGEIIKYDKSKDYSNVRIPTLKQGTHVNYALQRKNGTILASLFHQGKVISIDIKNNSFSTVVHGLKQSHSILEFEDKVLIADSNNGRVLVLNRKFSIIHEIKIPNSWIQDIAIQTSLNKKSRLFVVDATNSILYEYNLQNLSLIDSYKINPNWRISGIFVIEI